MKIQTEKLNLLKKEYYVLNTNCIKLEKENEGIYNNLANVTLKLRENEEIIKDNVF